MITDVKIGSVLVYSLHGAAFQLGSNQCPSNLKPGGEKDLASTFHRTSGERLNNRRGALRSNNGNRSICNYMIEKPEMKL